MDQQTIEIRPEEINAAKAAAIAAIGSGSTTIEFNPLTFLAMVHALYTSTIVCGGLMTMQEAVRQGAFPTITVEVSIE
jgi:hypothetical protein